MRHGIESSTHNESGGTPVAQSLPVFPDASNLLMTTAKSVIEGNITVYLVSGGGRPKTEVGHEDEETVALKWHYPSAKAKSD
jgi:hypothetical protein